MYHQRTHVRDSIKRSFYLDRNSSEALNKLSANAGITTSEIMRRLVDAAVGGKRKRRGRPVLPQLEMEKAFIR